MFTTALFVAAAASVVSAQQATYPATPLASKHFPNPTSLPFKVDTDTNLVRGPQHGYNQCNSTTEGPASLCQNFFFNGPGEFCISGPSDPDRIVADTEGEMLSWCSKAGHGTRLIPAGAITGLEYRKTPDYIQIVGFIDQSKINIKHGDFGGEMDPHGADGRGNPMGGTFWSNAFGSDYVQVIEWTNFMGSDTFTLKACNPKGKNPEKNCEHVYDRIGFAYNAPNAAKDGVFVACDADNADFPGIYTQDGKVVTYTQPPESLGAIQTMPYQPKVPASSNCKTFASTELFAGLPTGTSGSSTATGTAKTTSSGSAATGTAKGSTTGSGSSSASTPKSTGAAETVAISMAATLMGVAFSALFLA